MNKEEYIKQYMDKHAGSAYMTGAPAALNHGLSIGIDFVKWLMHNFELDGLYWVRLTDRAKWSNIEDLMIIYLDTLKTK